MVGEQAKRTRRCPWAGQRFHPVYGAALLVILVLLVITLAHHRSLVTRMLRADPDTILNQSDLRQVALDRGHRLFVASCAGCHGSGGLGRIGVPNLTDGDWLYGKGRVSEIEAIVRYGIRSRNSKGWNLASMPAYASLHPYAAEPLPSLNPGEVEDVVQLLLSYEGRPADPQAIVRGKAVYAKAGCWDCHGTDARGDSAIGAPDLRDATTLYGGTIADLRQTVEQGRKGVSPAFAARLSPADIRAVAVYAAALSHPARAHVQKDLP